MAWLATRARGWLSLQSGGGGLGSIISQLRAISGANHLHWAGETLGTFRRTGIDLLEVESQASHAHWAGETAATLRETMLLGMTVTDEDGTAELTVTDEDGTNVLIFEEAA